jgi:hypothetical protein
VERAWWGVVAEMWCQVREYASLVCNSCVMRKFWLQIQSILTSPLVCDILDRALSPIEMKKTARDGRICCCARFRSSVSEGEAGGRDILDAKTFLEAPLHKFT